MADNLLFCDLDAVPKKRGPKTDVLEALLKRVDGLEQKLKDQKPDAASADDVPDTKAESSLPSASVPTGMAKSSMGMAKAEPQADNTIDHAEQPDSPTRLASRNTATFHTGSS